MRKKVDTTVERGSGNVFADLGYSDAEGRLAKAELARAIHKLIVQRAWTQRRAADTLGLSAPDVSDLVRGKLARFSQERLERCLVALDMNVTIHVAPKSTTATRGRLAVDVAATGVQSAGK